MMNRRVRPDGFARSEDGGLLWFGLIVLLIMLFMGGMAVDLMRYEADRSRVQSTADAAALAAASMRQTRPIVDVVEDWFARAELTSALTDVSFEDELNYRTVRAETETRTVPFFMSLMGVEELRSDGVGAAEERLGDVEISLVLDISGSMEGMKMTRLKNAAKEFVQSVLASDDENKISITIVPYNGQVNVGPDLLARYNITNRHNNSHCVDLPAAAYTATALSPSMPMPQHADADTYNAGNTSNSWSTSNMVASSANRWCPPTAANRILAYSNTQNDPVTKRGLIQMIDKLEAIGATSIDQGFRWGAALIDPAARPIIDSLIDAGIVKEHFRGRPFDYGDPEALKVIVLMTDGEHWPNEHIANGYRSGPSPIYRHSDGNYSIYHASRSGSSKYWVPHRSNWQAIPWAGTSCTRASCVPTASNTPLDWATVWQNLRVQWVAQQMYRRALGGTHAQWVNTLRVREGTVIGAGPHEVSTMDGRLDNLCTLMKQKNVVIFGIAFEAPVDGKRVIKNCASPGRFYDVAGLDITTAFRSIRTQLTALRLTQ